MNRQQTLRNQIAVYAFEGQYWAVYRGTKRNEVLGLFANQKQAEDFTLVHNQQHAARYHTAQRAAKWRPAEPDETYPRPVRGIRMSGSPFALGY